MKRTYNSLEELMSSCSSSKLKSFVSSVLADNKYISWDFVSAVSNGDKCCSNFISPIKDTDLMFHLSWRVNAMGQYGHIFIGEKTK